MALACQGSIEIDRALDRMAVGGPGAPFGSVGIAEDGVTIRQHQPGQAAVNDVGDACGHVVGSHRRFLERNGRAVDVVVVDGAEAGGVKRACGADSGHRRVRLHVKIHHKTRRALHHGLREYPTKPLDD